MKTLRESLLDDDLVGKTDEMIRDEIRAFLKANYNGVIGISQKPNADGKYEVTSVTYIEVKNRNTRQLVRKIREYVEFLKENKDFTTTIVDDGDGIAISVKNN